MRRCYVTFSVGRKGLRTLNEQHLTKEATYRGVPVHRSDVGLQAGVVEANRPIDAGPSNVGRPESTRG